jgi:tetratricopeptide (TPR) repeat protein
MRIVVVLLGIVLVNASIAKAYTWEAVCDVVADYALGLENYLEAIRLHQELLSSHPGNALAQYHLGFAYGMTGRSEDEIREYVAAVTLGANNWDLYLINCFVTELLGHHALVDGPTPAVPDGAELLNRVLFTRVHCVSGGTVEIQSNIIGERTLGLPK